MDKDVRFTPKKVDESWKEEIAKVKPEAVSQGGASSSPSPKKVKTSPESQKKFINFLMNLATQALYFMGVIEGAEKDLNGAEEIISILKLLRERTEDNLSAEEQKAFEKILYDLQMQFVQASKPSDAPEMK